MPAVPLAAGPVRTRPQSILGIGGAPLGIIPLPSWTDFVDFNFSANIEALPIEIDG